MTAPLARYKIVDLTRVLSGPFCTMLLGDLGADVIKVESPGGGDPIRQQEAGRNGMSWYFATFNRNKRSIVIDLKAEEGREALARLIREADVLVENFRPGVLARLGFSAERLQELRPGLVTCSISGFGANGPYRDRPAFDFIAQAMSGFMSTNGGAADPPLRSGLPISDLVSGIYAALGIVSALLRRETSPDRPAEHIDISLTASMTSLLAYVASHYFATGEVLPRAGNDHPIASPYGLFQTADQPIAIAPSDTVFFRRLATALDLPELLDDPDFDTAPSRIRHRQRLNGIIEARLRTSGAADWIDRLNEAGVPCGPVYDVAGVFADAQMKAQEMTITAEHPEYGEVRMLGFPMKFAQQPCVVRRPPPLMNEHASEILDALGIEADKRHRLAGMNEHPLAANPNEA